MAAGSRDIQEITRYTCNALKVRTQMVLGETTLAQAITSKKATVTGSQKDLTAVFASFGQD